MRNERFKPDPLVVEGLEAAERGDTALVVELLSRGLDVNAKDSIGTTLLHKATRGGHLELMQMLLDRGADQTLENSLGSTALTVSLILSRTWEGWNVPRPDPKPLELLLANGGRYRLRETVMLNDVALARARLDEGADANTGEWTYNGPLLKIAAERGDLEIVDLLLDRGANIEATDDLGQRPLLSAARSGRTEVVRRLLDRGAEINAVDWSGQSALSNAIIEGHQELFDLVLSRGAERGIVDALALNDIPLLESQLDERVEAGFDVDRISDGRDRLAMLAVRLGHLDAVSLLLSRGAVHLHVWQNDHTLLAEAAKCGHVEVAKLLLERGAELHETGSDGLTPLAWAIREGHEAVVYLLKNAGAEE